MKKQSWIVTVRCVVTKELVCEKCTEQEAEQAPWDYSIDERELGQDDWEILSVTRND